MSAGRGIVHSERPPPELIGTTDVLEGLQLWVGLPAEREESAPSFQHADRDALPIIERDGVKLQVRARGFSRAARANRTGVAHRVCSELEGGAQLADVPELGVYVVCPHAEDHAPNARLRPDVITVSTPTPKKKPKTKRRLDWVTLHQHTFGTDVLRNHAWRWRQRH